MVPIRVIVGELSLEGELDDTPTAEAFRKILPFSAEINTWGDEFYFGTPVRMELDETATCDVDIGTIGYWPPGRAVAIFFGPTPLSSGPKPVPASEVSIIGRLPGAERFRGVRAPRKIRIEIL